MSKYKILNRTNAVTMFFRKTVLVIIVTLLSETSLTASQTIYPDGGRNVIPLVRNKASRAQPYNDGTVMAHVIGSAGMNFLYYFHVLGVACENADAEFYKIIQKDFEFCINKTGPIPPQLRNQPLGSIPKPCVDWKIHKPCFENLADDYDECLANRPGLVKKGTDALRFTHAYAKFICGNIADTEAHLLDRFTKHDLIVVGVFQCFPHLQNRIVNCVKRDKISKTLCSKFYIVHACFGKYYNEDNCQDVQPIYYMDDLFRNMSTSLSCPKDDNEWIYRDGPTGPPPSTPGGWTHEPPKKGWSSREELPKRGWSSSREEPSVKENPWPGERGRPWSNNDHGPFVRGAQPTQQATHHHHPNNPGWESSSESTGRFEGDRPTVDPHANRPYPDTSWNTRPWDDAFDTRGTASAGMGWEQGRNRNNNEVDTRGGGGFSSTRGPTSSYQYVTNRGLSSTSSFPGERGWYSTTPRGAGGGFKSAALPPSGFAITRKPQDIDGNDDEQKYTRLSPSLSSTTSNNRDLGFNFYSFE